MIVRDEEDNLAALPGIGAGIFDEIVVVDTGSVDRTREIAREFGARVFDFVWVDDFAAARNAALARATGDYAFWLDADDVVEPPEREKLAGAARRACGAGDAGRPTSCAAPATPAPTAAAARPSSITSGCSRSARTSAGPIASTSRSCPPCGGPGIPVRWTDLIVRHTGYVDLALRARKLDARRPRSSARSWRTGPTTRSSCSTWARSPSSGRTGARRWTCCAAAWPARRRPTRSRGSCSP